MVYLFWFIGGVCLLLIAEYVFFVVPEMTSILSVADHHWDYFYVALTAHDLILSSFVFVLANVIIRKVISQKIPFKKIAIMQIPFAAIAFPEAIRILLNAGDIEEVGYVYYKIISSLFQSCGLIIIWSLFSTNRKPESRT